MQMLNRSSTNRVASGSKPGFLDKAKAGECSVCIRMARELNQRGARWRGPFRRR